MSGSISNYNENLILTWNLTANAATRPAAWFVALGTGSTDAALTGEPSGNGYARQSANFTVTADVGANNVQLVFGPCTGADWGPITHTAIFDAVTGGNMLWHGPLTTARTIQIGDTLTMSVGALTATLS